MFSTLWLKDTIERVLATFAEAAIPAFVGADLFNINYVAALGLSGSAAAVAFLKAIVATRVGDESDASLVK
ncbi:holin [Gordonia phage Guey18]|nr:holin [Gordonia phage Guey18]